MDNRYTNCNIINIVLPMMEFKGFIMKETLMQIRLHRGFFLFHWPLDNLLSTAVYGWLTSGLTIVGANATLQAETVLVLTICEVKGGGMAMVTFMYTLDGYQVQVDGQIIGYVTKERGFSLSPSTMMCCITISASDLTAMAKKVEEVTKK